ncbi:MULTISPECIES: hypothetical protein [unclassified Nocardia]|uniref:hypothetical protein n=1 Tax=unclassified Nocardia TaxID=2637762 RepID=UPI0035E2A392
MTEPVRGSSAPLPLQQQLRGTAAAAQHAACAVIGRDVDLYSELELQIVLFDELDLPPTPDSATDTASLRELYDNDPHPFLEHLLAYRDTMGRLGDLG